MKSSSLESLCTPLSWSVLNYCKHHNSLRTCSILVLILSNAPRFWIHFSYKHFAQTPRKTVCILDGVTALHSIVRYAEMCLPRRCLETDCITPFYCCVRVSWAIYWAVAWQRVDQMRYNIRFDPQCLFVLRMKPTKTPNISLCGAERSVSEWRGNVFVVRQESDSE
jgi:hypothetical protein